MPPVQGHVRFSPQAVVGLLMVSFAMTEYSTLWIYPNVQTEVLFSAQSGALGQVASSVTRVFGSEFRLLVWLSFSVGYVVFLLTRPVQPAIMAIAPFIPFIAFASISSLIGEIPGTSIWYMKQWLVMATAAAVAGQLCDTERMWKAGAIVIAIGAFGSLFLGVVSPRIALASSGGSMLLRGMFTDKNMTGWFACLGLVWIFVLRTAPLRPVSYATLAALVLMLLWTGSKTSLAVVISVAAFLLLVHFLKQLRVHWIGRSILTVAALAISVFLVQSLLPILVEALGKDPTLSGRTTVWDAYLRFMETNYWFGRGPGVFAFASEMNQRVAETMEEGQRIYGVHSMYLALFGDTGFFGLWSYVIAFSYVLLIPVYRNPSPGNTAAAAFALSIMITGFSEAVEHIVPGVGTFMLIATRSNALRGKRTAMAENLRFAPMQNRYFVAKMARSNGDIGRSI